MAEAIDIRELNERIEKQSAFVTNLITGMDQVIVGQKHLVESQYNNEYKNISIRVCLWTLASAVIN